MNFIDCALAQGRRLSDDDFLQAMADIYREPQVWQELDRYPPYIRDVIYVIDYDTEVQMEGLDACAVCARLGGGGHAAAAGCSVPGTVEEAEQAVLAAVRQVEHGQRNCCD